ncbi:hypothetical protein GCM10023340_24190 [Nocardioides marinquilinus]|uniref:Family 43 glycosylhydrolase n=1 Tax=Nocardioides marinquilinus TaxID=1210400 RepID=A0ABP9PN38_9ACTN
MRFSVGRVVPLLLLTGLLVVPARPGQAAPADQAGTPSARAAGSSFAMGDPDTVLAEDGRYVTYGTTVPPKRGDRCSPAARGKLYVPMLVHGGGAEVGLTDCASGDALPGGPGAWAVLDSGIWAPGVARYKGRWLMYYTASKRGTGRKCLGLAVSGSAYGPFRDAGSFVCPADRWAIDANPVVRDGTLWVAYRDDGVTSGPETAISVVRADRRGRAVPGSRRTLLRSTDIAWDTRGTDSGSHVVENPSLFAHKGRWHLAFAGNQWASPRYATGLAECGPASARPGPCRLLRDGANRPYFGFVGPGGIGPYRRLPGNRRGPGGLDVYTAAGGGLRVTWHWYDGRLRHPTTGTLTHGRGGFRVD